MPAGPLLRDPGPLRSGLYDQAYANLRTQADDEAAEEYRSALLETTRIPPPNPVIPEQVLAKTVRPGIERNPVQGTPVFGSDEAFSRVQQEASTLADTTPLGENTPSKPGFKAPTTLQATPEPKVLASVNPDWATAFPEHASRPAPPAEPEILKEPPKVVNASYTPLAPESHSVFNRAMSHIVKREGLRTEVYKDSLGNPTVGVGHLIKPEDNLKVGDKIDKEKVKALLHKDATAAYEAAQDQMAELGIKDESMLEALISVNFQLGPNWTQEFDNSWDLIKEGRYKEASTRLKSSHWYKQTPERVRDFQSALNRLAKGE